MILPENRLPLFGIMRMSALHQIDVLNRDGAAIAEENNKNGEADGGFRRRDRQYEKREDLADDVAEMRGKRDQIDIDREQDELDRHQDDDDVLAVQEDAEDPEREQDGGNREIMSKPDGHRLLPSPCPVRALTTSIDMAGVRSFW